MDTIDETSKQVLLIARSIKTNACVHEGGITDIPGVVVLQQGDGFLCALSPFDGHPIDNLPKHLGALTENGIPQFETVSVITDTFYKHFDTKIDEDKAKNWKPGSFAKEYAENPNSNIAQALCVMTYTQDGQKKGGMVTYHYDDVGQPIYTEIEVSAEDAYNVSSPKIDFVIEKFIEWCKIKRTAANN